MEEEICTVTPFLSPSFSILLFMKIISLNIRGIGVGKESKVDWLKKVCRIEKPNILLLQETKLHSVDINWIRVLWGNHNCDFIQKEIVEKSGGQLIIWDTSVYDVVDSFISEFCIGVHGNWVGSGKDFYTINIYGPHDDPNKLRMWDFLSSLLCNNEDAWVLGGDFNEVREEDDRFNCVFVESRVKKFNEFIADNRLIDIPLGGRKFTRVSDDGLI
ncbi:uncharacterized protein [Rutidosis leptorrhynchoides]|uniref:uncharacterized protein n=1 Tax=Rutidosis leptorrhynchoides TaxID=125765 RepID=UPI003A9A04C4